MQPFQYERPDSLKNAARTSMTEQGQTDARVQFLAGGTTLIDLMKLSVLTPQQVVDLNPAGEGDPQIELDGRELKLGAFAKMATVAAHPDVRTHFPVIAESLDLAASAQLRNMATLGGNVLQRTRCPYYRDITWDACNKRVPGSGCSAIGAFNRNHAVLGVDDSCISQYPGDLAIALIALDAEVDLVGREGPRRMQFASLHRAAEGKPHIETTLRQGDIITGFRVALGPWARRSRYVKVRDRASYEFAIASAAVALDLDGEQVRAARIGLGGMAYRPWRAREAEEALVGKALTEATAGAAATAALAAARTHGYNDYKPELARRTIVRALLEAKALQVS